MASKLMVKDGTTNTNKLVWQPMIDHKAGLLPKLHVKDDSRFAARMDWYFGQLSRERKMQDVVVFP